MLGSEQTITLVLYGFGAITIVLFTLYVHLYIRFKKVFRGKKAQDFETVLNAIQSQESVLLIAQKEIREKVNSIDMRVAHSIRGAKVIRFNPFKGTSGSNQSFSIAFLNERGDGAVLSSLYSREHVSTYAKPIENLTSQYELTPEEKEAIARAVDSGNHK